MANTTDRLGRNQIDDFTPFAARVLDAEGIVVDMTSRAHRTLLPLLMRANKELAAIDLARLKGDFGHQPSDPIMLAALDHRTPRQHAIPDLICEYRPPRSKSAGGGQPTITAHKPVYRLLRKTFGDTRDLRTIGREDGRPPFNMIVGMPMNLRKTKALDGLTIV